MPTTKLNNDIWALLAVKNLKILFSWTGKRSKIFQSSMSLKIRLSVARKSIFQTDLSKLSFFTITVFVAAELGWAETPFWQLPIVVTVSVLLPFPFVSDPANTLPVEMSMTSARWSAILIMTMVIFPMMLACSFWKVKSLMTCKFVMLTEGIW